ncbi:hypothetical protein BaRGS_00036554 [Batillaria attramentaria]|uniref:Uncharacterized protein n=1 Tax=Batillaria attramentaria TaxID=370345 RepID=A0ABD0JBM7_9CAEN
MPVEVGQMQTEPPAARNSKWDRIRILEDKITALERSLRRCDDIPSNTPSGDEGQEDSSSVSANSHERPMGYLGGSEGTSEESQPQRAHRRGSRDVKIDLTKKAQRIQNLQRTIASLERIAREQQRGRKAAVDRGGRTMEEKVEYLEKLVYGARDVNDNTSSEEEYVRNVRDRGRFIKEERRSKKHTRFKPLTSRVTDVESRVRLLERLSRLAGNGLQAGPSERGHIIITLDARGGLMQPPCTDVDIYTRHLEERVAYLSKVITGGRHRPFPKPRHADGRNDIQENLAGLNVDLLEHKVDLLENVALGPRDPDRVGPSTDRLRTLESRVNFLETYLSTSGTEAANENEDALFGDRIHALERQVKGTQQSSAAAKQQSSAVKTQVSPTAVPYQGDQSLKERLVSLENLMGDTKYHPKDGSPEGSAENMKERVDHLEIDDLESLAYGTENNAKGESYIQDPPRTLVDRLEALERRANEVKEETLRSRVDALERHNKKVEEEALRSRVGALEKQIRGTPEPSALSTHQSSRRLERKDNVRKKVSIETPEDLSQERLNDKADSTEKQSHGTKQKKPLNDRVTSLERLVGNDEETEGKTNVEKSLNDRIETLERLAGPTGELAQRVNNLQKNMREEQQAEGTALAKGREGEQFEGHPERPLISRIASLERLAGHGGGLDSRVDLLEKAIQGTQENPQEASSDAEESTPLVGRSASENFSATADKKPKEDSKPRRSTWPRFIIWDMDKEKTEEKPSPEKEE